MLEIETGIPMPTKPAGRGTSKYPFDVMNVGDSFVVDLYGKTWAFIFEAIKKAQQRHPGRKFSTRAIEPTKRRVWRVE